MMDKLSDSVAITSNPVNKDDGEDESERIQREMSLISESFFSTPGGKEDQPIQYTHPSNDSNESTLRNGNYRNSKEENQDLKAQIVHLHKQIQNLEKVSRAIIYNQVLLLTRLIKRKPLIIQY
jgi:hypothetical protein